MSNPDAASRISFYEQTRGTRKSIFTKMFGRSYWDKQLKSLYDIDLLVSKAGTKYLSNMGCNLFTHAHAIQWLTERKADDSRQIEILYELIQQSSQPPTALDIYQDYFKTHYGFSVLDPGNADYDHISSMFAQGGVYVWNPYGHIALAVGCTEHQGKHWILIVDSSSSSSFRRISGGNYNAYAYKYDFSEKAEYTPYKNNYGQYWIPYEIFIDHSRIGLYLPK